MEKILILDKTTTSMHHSLSSAFNGILTFGVGIFLCWAIGYWVGVAVTPRAPGGGKRSKSILPDAFGFVGLFLGALVLKDHVFK